MALALLHFHAFIAVQSLYTLSHLSGGVFYHSPYLQKWFKTSKWGWIITAALTPVRTEHWTAVTIFEVGYWHRHHSSTFPEGRMNVSLVFSIRKTMVAKYPCTFESNRRRCKRNQGWAFRCVVRNGVTKNRLSVPWKKMYTFDQTAQNQLERKTFCNQLATFRKQFNGYIGFPMCTVKNSKCIGFSWKYLDKGDRIVSKAYVGFSTEGQSKAEPLVFSPSITAAPPHPPNPLPLRQFRTKRSAM